MSFLFNNVTTSNAKNDMGNVEEKYITEMENKIAEIQKEMYMRNLIQYIEFESEIIIPNYLDIKYVEYIFNVANQLNIPTRIAFRMVYTESRFNDIAISPKGARGLMQLMPDTRTIYIELLGIDTMKIDENQKDILIGFNYLKDLKTYWFEKGNNEKYSWKLGLASYNAGKRRVQQYQGVPPFNETQKFVNFILRIHSNPEFFANYNKKYENKIKVNT